MASGKDVERQFAEYLRTQHPDHLAAVFEALKPELLAASRRAGLDEQGAEDVVQETFLGVINAQDRFEEGRPFIPWVRGIALRQINAERRRRARLLALFRPSDGQLEEGEESRVDADPAELRAQIEEGLRSLSERNRQVVHAALFEGLDIEELSERFDLTKTAASVRLHRGLLQLRERLGRPSNLGLFGAIPARSGASRAKSGGSSISPKAISVKSWMAISAATMLAAVGLRFALVDRSLDGHVDAASEVDAVAIGGGALDAASKGEDLLTAGGSHADAATDSTDSPEAADGPIDVPLPSLVTGSVIESGGAPAPPGVEVFVLQTTPELVLPVKPLTPDATTDVNGQFALDEAALGDDPTPLLMVRYGTQVGWVDVDTADIARRTFPPIELTPETRIDVSVVDTNGLPVENASLVGFTHFPRFMAPIEGISRKFGFLAIKPYRHLFSATTDSKGQGSIRSLFGREVPQPAYFMLVSKDGYASAMHAYPAPPGEHIEADVTLRSLDSLSFSGRVIDEDGAPIAGAKLTFVLRGEVPVDGAAIVTTDASSEWSIPSELLSEYPLIVRVEREGYSGVELSVAQPEELSSQPYVVTLPREAPLTVTVRDSEGRPVANAEVTIATEGTIKRVMTGEDGTHPFRGLRRSSRRLTVLAGVENESLRSAAKSAGAAASEVDVVLPKVARRIARVEVTTGGGSDWKTASLLAYDVTGFEGALASAEVLGGAAYFEGVPEGEWVFCGMSMAGEPTIESLKISGDLDASGSQGEGVSFEVQPANTGGVNLLIAQSGEAVTLGPCVVVMRRTDLPGLPDWLQLGTNIAWTELYRMDDAKSLIALDSLAEGNWSAFAMGEGWAVPTARFEVRAGEVTRLDLAPSPAGVVSFLRPGVMRSGLARIETRRRSSDPWDLVGLMPFSHDWPEPFDVTLPEGNWQWRATLQFQDDRGQFADSFPPTYGSLRVDASSTATIDMATAAVVPPE